MVVPVDRGGRVCFRVWLDLINASSNGVLCRELYIAPGNFKYLKYYFDLKPERRS